MKSWTVKHYLLYNEEQTTTTTWVVVERTYYGLNRQGYLSLREQVMMN